MGRTEGFRATELIEDNACINDWEYLKSFNKNHQKIENLSEEDALAFLAVCRSIKITVTDKANERVTSMTYAEAKKALLKYFN